MVWPWSCVDEGAVDTGGEAAVVVGGVTVELSELV